MSARKAARGWPKWAGTSESENERERESKNVEKGGGAGGEAEGVAIEDRENDEAGDVEMDREKSLPPRN